MKLEFTIKLMKFNRLYTRNYVKIWLSMTWERNRISCNITWNSVKYELWLFFFKGYLFLLWNCFFFRSYSCMINKNLSHFIDNKLFTVTHSEIENNENMKLWPYLVWYSISSSLQYNLLFFSRKPILHSNIDIKS